MKREEVLAVLDSEIATIPVYRRWGKALGYAVDEVFVVNQLREVRAFIASALDDAERYRHLRRMGVWLDPDSVYLDSTQLDTAADTARAAAAGGEGVL